MTDAVRKFSIAIEDPLKAAVDWRRENPDAYEQVVLWARQDMRHGGRPSIGLYAELLRRPYFANNLRLVPTDEVYLINNNLRALIARLVMREAPDIVFPTRSAYADYEFMLIGQP